MWTGAAASSPRDSLTACGAFYYARVVAASDEVSGMSGVNFSAMVIMTSAAVADPGRAGTTVPATARSSLLILAGACCHAVEPLLP
jgi:hypothetical protein